MTGQQWRKALWHLRHGGLDGLKRYTQKSSSDGEVAKTTATRDSSTDAMPSLSVIVPAFNAADFIDSCLHSILGQQSVSIEVVVIDDGSNDETAAKVMEHTQKDDRVKID